MDGGGGEAETGQAGTGMRIQETIQTGPNSGK